MKLTEDGFLAVIPHLPPGELTTWLRRVERALALMESAEPIPWCAEHDERMPDEWAWCFWADKHILVGQVHGCHPEDPPRHFKIGEAE